MLLSWKFRQLESNPMGAPSIERGEGKKGSKAAGSQLVKEEGKGVREGRPICEGRVTVRRFCRNGWKEGRKEGRVEGRVEAAVWSPFMNRAARCVLSKG